MRLSALMVALPLLACACDRQDTDRLTPVHRAAMADSVRTFMRALARDVTAQGPRAWRDYFADTSAFYMAAEGRLVVPSSDSATQLINQLANVIRQLELRWESAPRVDVLGPGLAALAAPYFESRVDTAGRQFDETGYFTAIAASRAGRWQLLSAHWSVVPPER